MRYQIMLAAISTMIGLTGCTVNVDPTSDPVDEGEGAAIIGSVVTSGSNLRQVDDDCPAIRVELNGAEARLVIDDDCGFLISGVGPAGLLEIRVSVPDLGIAGTVEVTDVVNHQLIEIMVEVTDDSLSITVVRQQQPESVDDLPAVVSSNNVLLQIPQGRYVSDLAILGNNFTLVGVAGSGCQSPGWSVLAGDVVVEGNNATFRNVIFEGSVQILGNNAYFINSCFDGQLIIFGNNAEIDPGGGGDEDDGDDDEGGNGDDNGDDD